MSDLVPTKCQVALLDAESVIKLRVPDEGMRHGAEPSEIFFGRAANLERRSGNERRGVIHEIHAKCDIRFDRPDLSRQRFQDSQRPILREQ
jgi:hypothetical protein